jgi:hypothetical protein
MNDGMTDYHRNMDMICGRRPPPKAEEKAVEKTIPTEVFWELVGLVCDLAEETESWNTSHKLRLVVARLRGHTTEVKP